MGKIKGVFINVVTKTVTEVEIERGLEPIYQLIGCQLIESCYSSLFAPIKHVMFCDEEGLLNEPKGGFKIFDYSPICGNAVIFASDEYGELQNNHLVVEKFKELIQFVDISEIPEPKIEVLSWDEFIEKLN
jgi:hypothetical protein